MSTNLGVLQLLRARGWRLKYSVGRLRVLEHPDRPWVFITLRGRPSDRISKSRLRRILAIAGMHEEEAMKYPILIEKTAPDCYCVSSPDVDGCVSTGDSIEDAVAGFREALEIHLRFIREAGGQVPLPETLVDTVEVTVA